MLALHSGMERLRLEAGMGASSGSARHHQEQQQQQQQQPQQINLPPSIALPDGEEFPYGSSARMHIRDPEQESEIYQKCIRPPPNRTVFDGESPPPYRGVGGRCHQGGVPAVIVPSRHSPSPTAPFPAGPGKHSTNSSVGAGLVRFWSPAPAERAGCHVTCRTADDTPPPCGVSSSPEGDSHGPALAALTMVPCLTETRTETKPPQPSSQRRPAPGPPPPPPPV